MTRIRELITAAAQRYPNDTFFSNFAESCRMEVGKRRAYRSYDDALRLLDPDSWAILKDKAIRHFVDHRSGQRKQGFFNQLNEAFAYRYLRRRRNCTDVKMLPEENVRTPDIRYREAGQLKHCEVKTIGLSDAEIGRRQSRGVLGTGYSAQLDSGFFNKFSSVVATAKAQISARKTDGLVYLVVLFDDMALDHYPEYRRQLISFCREMAIYFTQVAPTCCGRGYGSKRAYFTSDSYGAGSTATAC